MKKEINKQEKLELLIKEQKELLEEAGVKDGQLVKNENKILNDFYKKNKKQYAEVDKLYKKYDKMHSDIHKLREELKDKVCTVCGKQLD